jgi:Zn-dependent protease with chaperone function
MKSSYENVYFQYFFLINCLPIFTFLLWRSSEFLSSSNKLDDSSDFRSFLSDSSASEQNAVCWMMEPYALMLKEMFENNPFSGLQNKIIHLTNIDIDGQIAGIRSITNGFEIFINDKFLSHFSLDEIKGVLAHELGHASLNHIEPISIWLIIIRFNLYVNEFHFFVTSIFGMLYFDDFRQHKGLTSIFMHSGLFLLATLGLMFLLSQYSQFKEFQADAESLKFHSNPESLISFFKKISHMTVNNFSLFNSHPSDEDRILALRSKI